MWVTRYPRSGGRKMNRHQVSKRPTVRRIVVRVAIALVLLVAAGVAILRMPQPLFAWSATSGNITLYSDAPFREEAGRKVLDLVRAKLERSPLYVRGQHDVAFICNTQWRRAIFFNRKYRVGGLCYYPITSHVFLRTSVVEENRMRGPSGKLVPGNRPLDYFIAHELTHAMTGRYVGPLRYHRLPVWLREGYADYVGTGGDFDYDQMRLAFLAGARDLDPARSGLYLRYHLLVAHYLEKERWSIDRLLASRPSQAEAEQAVRREAGAN